MATWPEREDAEVEPGGFIRGKHWQAALDAIEALHERCMEQSYYTGGSAANSTGAEAALAAWTASPTGGYTFRNGHIYRGDVQLHVYSAAASFSTIERVTVLVRQAVNSTVATSLGGKLLETQGTSSSGATHKSFSVYFKNTTGADLTGVNPGITVTRSTGAAANHIYGDASFPMTITFFDMGITTDLPTLAAIAVALT